MIAIFCRYERDFKDNEASPRKMFRRIRNINDCRGITFTGIIRYYEWYKGDKEVMDAYEYLRVVQPELFD